MTRPELAPRASASEVLDAARQAGLSIATAESLTGGSVCHALVSVPGASAHVMGGVVAYDASAKVRALGVDAEVMAEHGVVSEPTAVAMARGASALLGADVAVATTGVAGPEPHGGTQVGTVCIGVWGPREGSAVTLVFPGDRVAVTDAARTVALGMLRDRLAEYASGSAVR